MADNAVYPKIPESNWWAIRNQFKKSIPVIVTSSYLKSLLNLTSERAAGNLLPPLRQMKIIDDENKPTDRANDWRNDENYSSVCTQIAAEIYPQELRDLNPGPDYDKDKIVRWFMHDAKLGDGAAKLCASMFTLLCTADIKPEQNGYTNLKPRNVKSKQTEKNSAKKLNKEPHNSTIQHNPENQENNQYTERNGKNPPALHIDLQVHISPEASTEQIDAIFASIAKHLYDKA